MFVVSLVIIWYIRRKKKINEVLLSQQIRQLKEVWQIGWGEITVQEEIGGGASGRVLLARYRDTFVAVKMLKDDDPQDVFKFTEEIKFMQTMRHPNIVLFLGAGKTPEERPFLVLEFIRRGSLRKVLDDESTLLSTRRKIHFATDAAKGMAFLHNLNPPRIHRDLKGENLLVSESWIVMVADFGLGRCFKSEQPRQRKRHRPITEPLLEEEHLSLDGIGTARWSAPELSRREKYDGSIDVYR
jgi:serine/threonine protein kinase